MKVIDVTTVVVGAGMRNWVFVKVTTDEGLVGWGEATTEWKTRGVVGAVEDLAPLVVGQDPNRRLSSAVNRPTSALEVELVHTGAPSPASKRLAIWWSASRASPVVTTSAMPSTVRESVLHRPRAAAGASA